MHIQTDRAFVPAGAPVVRYLHITVNAPAAEGKTDGRPPASISLVLDRSGSMDGQKIAMAHEATRKSIELLKPTDSFAVVCYDEEVTTVAERTPATKEAKKMAIDRLARIGARGSTDLHGGWVRGAELVTPTPANSGGISKVMLLTDGLANQGVVEPSQLLAVARRLRAEGVVTSTFGVGEDFDEELLSRIATEGGGHFYFIERPKQIPDLLASELGETLEVVARDAVLELTCDPGVDAMPVNQVPFEAQASRIRISLGHLVSEQELTVVVAVVFKGARAEASSLGVQCALSDRDGVLPSMPMAVTWEAVDSVKDANQRVNGDVMFAVASVLSERARPDALAANAAGNFDAAKRIVEEVLNDLRAMAPDDKRIVRLIDRLHRDAVEVGEEMAPLLRKAQHFASYQVMHSREAGGTARRRKPRP